MTPVFRGRDPRLPPKQQSPHAIYGHRRGEGRPRSRQPRAVLGWRVFDEETGRYVVRREHGRGQWTAQLADKRPPHVPIVEAAYVLAEWFVQGGRHARLRRVVKR